MKKSKTIVKLSEQIIPKYYSTFNATNYTHKIFTSGRAGTKSSRGAIRAVYKVISDPDCAVVIIRKHHNKLSKTVYKEILRAIKRLGLTYRDVHSRNKKADFYVKKSPMEVTYLKNGNTIYFTGSDSIDDTKGMIDESKPIKLVELDELTEFFDDGEGEDEIMNIEATFIRGNDDEFTMEYYFNPPKNPKEPIMQWVNKMEQRSDAIHIHNDYRDVPIDWLGRKLIASAEEMLKSDELMYRWLWLGECVGVPDVIYYMFNEEKHVYEPNKDDYDNMSLIGIGIDYGQLNATTYQAFGLDINRKCIQGIDEYYHSGRDTQKQKSPSEYAVDFKKFKEQIEKETGKHVHFVFYDPSARGLAEEIKRVCFDIELRKADNSVDLGISRVQKLYSLGRLFLSPKQKCLIEEMSLYKYDEKSIDRGKEQPLKANDHGADAERYLCMGMWRYLRHVLPMLKEYE